MEERGFFSRKNKKMENRHAEKRKQNFAFIVRQEDSAAKCLAKIHAGVVSAENAEMHRFCTLAKQLLEVYAFGVMSKINPFFSMEKKNMESRNNGKSCMSIRTFRLKRRRFAAS